MNEWNIGVDIVDVPRFGQLPYPSNKRFYERIFTTREIEHCLSFKDPAPHFAANFAAKEAVQKAMNKICDVKLKEVEVLTDDNGAPRINLLLKQKHTRMSLPFEIKVSISHSALHAIAFVVVSCPREL